MAIVVTSPNGAERFYVDRAKDITWTDSTSQNVKIELSINNGADWTELEDSTASVSGANSWSWTPLLAQVSEECLIRISPTAGGGGDQSNAVFTILEPTLQLTAPNTAVVYRKFNGIAIAWSSPDPFVTAVNILMSIDGGSTFPLTLASGINPGVGYNGYPILLDDTNPGGSASYTQCRIRVISAVAGDADNYDDSDTNFTVQEADNTPSGAYTNKATDFPTRFNTYAAVGGEKAILEDEAVMKGQIYGSGDGTGTGDVITFRLANDGSATANDIVIDTVRKIPRTLAFKITLATLDSSYTTAQGYYGDHYYADFVHNWDLGTTELKRRLSWQVENLCESPVNTYSRAQVEIIDGNTIRLHMVRKGMAYTTLQPKDQVDINQSNVFFVKLVETPYTSGMT